MFVLRKNIMLGRYEDFGQFHIFLRMICLLFGAYITRLIPRLFIEVCVSRLEDERSCICALGILILTLTTILLSIF